MAAKTKTPKKKQSKFSLEKFSAQAQKFFKAQGFKYYAVVLGVVIVLIGGTLVYLDVQQINNYPQVSDARYEELETVLTQAIEYSKDKPRKAIQVLENYGKLPRLLENRKNYILAKLYDKIDETAMAFVRAYDIDRNYLTKYSCYMRAKLAEQIGLEGTVVSELDYLTDKYPHNPKFLYELAKSYSRQSQFEEVEKTFKVVQKTYPDSEYAVGAEYYLANITADKEDKFARFRRYLKKSPEGSLAYLISDQILKLDKADQARFSDLTNYMALSYYHQEDYDTAVEFFNSKFDSADLYLKAYAETLIKLRRKTDAKNLLIRKLPEIHKPELASELLELLLSLSPKYIALSQLKMLQNQMPKNKDKILWEIAKRTHSKESYKAVYDTYPNSFYAAESMSRVFWKEYRRGNYHKALDIYKKHWKQYPKAKSHPYVAFWAGKIHRKLEEKDQARAVLQNLIIAHPRSYYSYRAQQILDGKSEWYKLPGPNEFISFPSWRWPDVYSKNTIKDLYGKDILELTEIGEYRFVLDLDEAKEVKLDKDFKMWLYAKAEDHLKAISTAYFSLAKDSKIDYNDLKFQYAFPLPYADLVADEVSTNLKVDPLLAHALIKQESRYQKDIVSKVGAVGLMQLMPYTARDLARSMRIRPPRPRDLMQPDINIKLGIRYMEEVFRRFDNNMIHAVASYNAGPIAVNNWIKKYRSLEPDEFIERIPYDETKNYVKKVLNNFWIYKELYS